MIDPIGKENPVSPYERYNQYLQLKNNTSPVKTGSVWDSGPSQNQSASAGSAAPQGQNLSPGQVVQQNQQAQGAETFRNDPTRKSGAMECIFAAGRGECQTCKNREYQDRSDDPGVSYQTPTKISADRAASAVRAHENEHVVREQAKASRENREVVSLSVVLKTAICPECGRVYIAGGTTTTVTKAKSQDDRFQAGQPAESEGLFLNRNV